MGQVYRRLSVKGEGLCNAGFWLCASFHGERLCAVGQRVMHLQVAQSCWGLRERLPAWGVLIGSVRLATPCAAVPGTPAL